MQLSFKKSRQMKLRNKAFYSVVFTIFGIFILHAQVGIGTTSIDSSAILEVKSSSKGILIPKVALAGLLDSTTIASPATGLLVYNTNTSGTAPNNVFPGYYYYDGAKWVAISLGAGTKVNIQTAAYTLSINDTKGVLIINSAIAVNVTVPTGLPSGFFCQIIQKGTGQVTVVGASGLTLNSANGFKTRVQNSAIGVVLESASLGYISGDSTF